MDHQIDAVVAADHQVIAGVLRLACEGIPEVRVVDEAVTVADVLDAVRMNPRLLVMDLDRGDMDGLSLLVELRATGFSGWIVVLSDRTDGAVVLEAMRNGVSAYLAKPEGLRHVSDAIRRVIRGELVVDPALEQAAVLELGAFARKAREGSELSDALTQREREVLLLLADGLTMQQMGRRLGISPRTVETHVAKLYRKLEVRTRVQAVSRAASLGLVDLREP
jgi:DNA-binding NarL/FixJ family response regulator